MKGQRMLIGVLILGLLLILTAGPSPLSVSAANPHRPLADFNGDDYADLAVGVPYECMPGPPTVWEAGVVNVLYGSASNGLSGTDDQYWHQDTTGIVDMAENYDFFGSALAAGDFDGDGNIDLAVGVSGQTVGDEVAAGAVHVLYGSSPNGLSATDDEIWSQDTLEVTNEAGDYFGWSLAAGDFDGDGCDDLVVGVPFEDWGAQDSGIVHVLYGSASGLSATGNQLWRQGVADILETEEIGDHFGETLAAGDFNSDGYDDLVVGVQSEDFADPTRYDVGVVHVLYGSASGLSATGNQLWHQDRTDIVDTAEQYDAFGGALATGDFDGDGYTDLAVGVSGETVGTEDYAGAVHILYGSSGGLTAYGDQLLDQDDLWSAHDSDHFGRALAAADFNGDGYADLAVGVPHYDLGFDNIGCVNVLYGSNVGPSTTDYYVWFQGVLAGLEDEPEENDQFGEVLAAGDFNGDGYADLAVGVPYEDIGDPEEEDAGAVHILHGSASGLSNTDDQFWYQGQSGVAGTAEEDDRFGLALVAIPTVKHRIYLPLVLRNS